MQEINDYRTICFAATQQAVVDNNAATPELLVPANETIINLVNCLNTIYQETSNGLEQAIASNQK
jgi:hypothetical protein